MKKTAVIFWSGTGNTEAMANEVLAGMQSAGADAAILSCSEVDGGAIDALDAVALGCPAMGAEVLEEEEFAPMFESIKDKLVGKKVALFGSYGWVTANGCVPGRMTASLPESTWRATA